MMPLVFQGDQKWYSKTIQYILPSDKEKLQNKFALYGL